MTKEQQMLDELSKMSPMVISTAYLYAINYTTYGEDVTKSWLTATQNAAALEKAYRKGYYDALERHAKAECFDTTFLECDYCVHNKPRCMPKDSECDKCIKYSAGCLPSRYQQKKEE